MKSRGYLERFVKDFGQRENDEIDTSYVVVAKRLNHVLKS